MNRRQSWQVLEDFRILSMVPSSVYSTGPHRLLKGCCEESNDPTHKLCKSFRVDPRRKSKPSAEQKEQKRGLSMAVEWRAVRRRCQ